MNTKKINKIIRELIEADDKLKSEYVIGASDKQNLDTVANFVITVREIIKKYKPTNFELYMTDEHKGEN